MLLRACLAITLAMASAAAADAQPLSPRNANYTIDVTLDARARTLTARETLVWTNITSASTGELQFHLYYNAWRNADSTWMREHGSRRGGNRSHRVATKTSPRSTSRACR